MFFAMQRDNPPEGQEERSVLSVLRGIVYSTCGLSACGSGLLDSGLSGLGILGSGFSCFGSGFLIAGGSHTEYDSLVRRVSVTFAGAADLLAIYQDKSAGIWQQNS